jgi:hypothetical protein
MYVRGHGGAGRNRNIEREDEVVLEEGLVVVGRRLQREVGGELLGGRTALG